MTHLLKAFKPLLGDFLSTILFIAIFEVTHDIVVATVAGIATGVLQFAYLKARRRKLEVMQIASLALVIVLGSATLLTKDPRFVMLKPSIAGFAIACVMLKRGWQSRYMPQVVRENAGEGFLIAWGYVWAALYFAMAAGNLIAAYRFGLQSWAVYNAFVPTVLPLAVFFTQYLTTRWVVTRNIRAGVPPRIAAAPAE